jgi:plasmid stabilization system protein ParE
MKFALVERRADVGVELCERVKNPAVEPGQLVVGDGVLRHFTAAITTAVTAATHRERILRTFLDFRASAVEMGRSGAREYVLTSEHDPGMARRLAETLVLSGIEVNKALEPVSVGGRTLPAEGTYIVPMDQPSHRLIRNLLDPHTPMDADFVARQIERRANRLPDQIYDVTAWSMPSLWDVELIMADRATGAATLSLNNTRQMRDVASLRDAAVGYLMPWGTDAAAAVAEALREGIRVRSAGAEFTLGGRDYAVGTAIIRNSDNESDLPQRLARIATRHGAEVVPIDDSYVREGMSLGSGRVSHLTEPRVLLVYDRPG